LRKRLGRVLEASEMECMYCSEKATAYAVLVNGVKMNVCQKHLDYAKQLGVNKEAKL
jgi:hypothetical protein